MMKNKAPHELPEVFVACEVCSENGEGQNCYPPAEIALIEGGWICAECWEESCEGARDVFAQAVKASQFVKLACPARPVERAAPENSEADYVASAVAALEG